MNRIVVLYPRGYRSGGPEAIHQLVDELRRQGAQAFVSPLPGTEFEPRSDAYLEYDAPEIDRTEIDSGDVVIASEASVVELLATPARRRVLWWLSVDFALPFKHTLALTDPLRRARDLREQGPFRAAAHLVREAAWRARLRRDRRLEHVAQSRYAQRRVARLVRRPVRLLSDFTVTAAPDPARDRDRRLVAYNPAKGGELAVRALEGTGLAGLPLRGLSPVQLGAALDGCGFYLDLGNHPGKDRLPREAVLHGCVVVVAARGAGALDEDTPVPTDQRVATEGDITEAARRTLVALARDPAAARARQERYRSNVAQERATFRAEVAALLTAVRPS